MEPSDVTDEMMAVWETEMEQLVSQVHPGVALPSITWEIYRSQATREDRATMIARWYENAQKALEVADYHLQRLTPIFEQMTQEYGAFEEAVGQMGRDFRLRYRLTEIWKLTDHLYQDLHDLGLDTEE